MREASHVSHDYVPVGRLLVSTEQHPASLGRLLLVRGRSLIGLRAGAGGASSRRIWEVGRAARIAANYARRRRDAASVTLPAVGEVAMPVVADHKVFDLTAGRVATVLPPTTDVASMLAIVGQLRRAAACPLAPAVLDVDVHTRTYVEEYVDGRRLRGLDPSLRPPEVAAEGSR